MLVNSNHLIGAKILSVQSTSTIGTVSSLIIDPDSFKIIGFYIDSPIATKGANILSVSSIREYSEFGMVIDSIDELVAVEDVVKIEKVVKLHFDPIGLKVETKKGSKLGKVIDYTISSDDFVIQQIIVKRPLIKSFTDPELTIHRKEIVEITNTKIIVKNEEDVIKRKAMDEEFIPNFVNPFRKTGQDFAPSRTKTPADKDTE